MHSVGHGIIIIINKQQLLMPPQQNKWTLHSTPMFGGVVERRSLAGELSPLHARPSAALCG